ncbi:hypothetical protein ACE6H2_018161 [Prunus campanulata]
MPLTNMKASKWSLVSKLDIVNELLNQGSTEAAGAYDEEKVGTDIVKRALSYPLKLIAKNAGVNGSVVSEKAGGL